MEKYFRLLLFPVLISFTEGQNCTAEDGTEGIELWEDCYSIENTQSINLVCVMCPASQKLQGPIPPEIGLLTNLTVLNILLNNISGPIPSEIGDLTNLITLNLGYNNLSGPIPSEIGNLTNLNTLHLAGNHLSGAIPSEIGNLTNLEYLGLSQNQLYGVIPENICSLEDSVISQVLASGNYFCPPYPFCIEDSSIQESEYCDNGIECIADDGTDGNILWGSCYSIENTTVINLSGNNGNDLGSLYGPIPPEIGQFLNLDTLNLSLNNLSGTIPSEISYLNNLKTLNLYYNKLSGNLPSEIENLTGLENLFLNNNKMYGSIPSQVGNLSNLIKFHINQNFISGSIPPEIGNLGNLESLHIAENNLAGEIPSEMFNLQNLRYLNIRRVPFGMSPINGNNRFSQSYVFSNIVNLGSIETFIAPDCGLMGNIPPGIGNLQNLQTLNVQHNYLEGIIPESICDLNIDFNASSWGVRDFDLSGNNLCLPYPACVAGSGGLSNQDTSNCNIIDTLLSIEGNFTPSTVNLYQNYPNPFNPITTLEYELPEDSFVDVTIYDMLGNVVNNLVNNNQSSGYKSIQWNATNSQGEPVSAGVYLYKIQAGDFVDTKKMILLK